MGRCHPIHQRWQRDAFKSLQLQYQSGMKKVGTRGVLEGNPGALDNRLDRVLVPTVPNLPGPISVLEGMYELVLFVVVGAPSASARHS
jgi:hypothetical protein